MTLRHHKDREKLHQDHIIGCRGVKLFLLNDVTIITTVTSDTVTTVTITTVTI